MKHCYTSKGEDPKGKKACGLWESIGPDNCGELGSLRKSNSWSQGPGALRKLRCSLDFDWESFSSHG